MAQVPARPKDKADWKMAFGPLEEYLNDPHITEIMVNGPNRIFIEQAGLIKKTPVKFPDTKSLIKLIKMIAASCGKKIDGEHPLTNASLPDGSRVHCTLPPISVDWPTLTIRRHILGAQSHKQLIKNGTMDEKIAYFLNCCVSAKLNIVISGGTGSGKTTLLNILSTFISPHERIITIEDTTELKIKSENLVRLEARSLDHTGKKSVTIAELVRNALRMRPDRIIVGESRGGEAFDVLTAMNTGHEGSMTTLHANSARDGLRRLETMVLMNQVDIPLKVVRQHISSALHLIIQINRLNDGSRKITEIIEVAGMEGDTILTQDIFEWTPEEGFHSKGLVPQFIKIFKERGIAFPSDFFSDRYKVKTT